MNEEGATPNDLSSRLAQMEEEQLRHFRRAVFLLVYFTVAFACLAWEWDKHVHRVFAFLPIATVIVICVWVGCVAKHSRDLTRARKLALASSEVEPSGTDPAETSQTAIEPIAQSQR